jgi:hypothetical protein
VANDGDCGAAATLAGAGAAFSAAAAAGCGAGCVTDAGVLGKLDGAFDCTDGVLLADGAGASAAVPAGAGACCAAAWLAAAITRKAAAKCRKVLKFIGRTDRRSHFPST